MSTVFYRLQRGLYYTQFNTFVEEVPSDGVTFKHYEEYSKGIKIISLYENSPSRLDNVCPTLLKPSYTEARQKYKAHKKAIRTVKLDNKGILLTKLMPQSVLEEYCKFKIKFIKIAEESSIKPDNYDALMDILEFTSSLARKEFKFDLAKMFVYKRSKRFRQSVRGKDLSRQYFKVNPFSTITGRVVTAKSENAFPILTLPKDYRSILVPNNGVFVEFDFNGFDLRSALGLLGVPQPDVDIHEYNRKEVLQQEGITRDEMKKLTFRALYGSFADGDPMVQRVQETYNKKALLNKYFNKERMQVENPFGRRIKLSDEKLAISYLIQATSVDLFYEQAMKIHKKMNEDGLLSYVSFFYTMR